VRARTHTHVMHICIHRERDENIMYICIFDTGIQQQANRRDIRHIFLTNVVVRDTSELEALKKEMLKVFGLYCF
jgi:hypothetical protein